MKKSVFLAVSLLLFSAQGAASIPTPDTCEVPIVAGWNLVGAINKVPVHAFFNEPKKIVSVWKWNAAAKSWEFYSPTAPDHGEAFIAQQGLRHLNGMNRGEGIWINAAEPTTFNTCMDYVTLPPSPN